MSNKEDIAVEVPPGEDDERRGGDQGMATSESQTLLPQPAAPSSTAVSEQHESDKNERNCPGICIGTCIIVVACMLIVSIIRQT